MSRLHLFADESGNMDFTARGSRYFILTTIALNEFDLGDSLQRLRRDMGWRGVPLIGHFHATEDTQAVRDEVFGVIADYPFRIDATIYEKRKVKPHLYDAVSFYTMAWRLHLRHLMPQITKMGEELFVISASIGTKNKRRVFGEAVTDMVSQASRGTTFRTAAWDAACEPCLQAADYCCWAIQRKWEMEDERSYVLIKDKIASEFDMFQPSGEFYY